MDPHRLAELRSLAYHRRIAELLPSRPELLAQARGRVEQWVRDRTMHPDYAAAWAALLRLPAPDLAGRMTADDETGRALRQVTPFAGALDARERWRIHRAVRPEAAR